jgi:S-methylmethionine-dependent homocysteine/selenocysteine methylase
MLSAAQPLILDGAMGTELRNRGVDTGLPLWSANALLTSPDTVRRIHEEYILAGADIITTDTFRTTGRTFRRGALPDRSAELTAQAVRVAREARSAHGERHVLIAGSIAPLEDCYHPELVPPGEELEREHGELAARLAAEGVDFLLLETMGTVREAAAAAVAARASGLEYVVSFICDNEGRLLGGETISDALRAILPHLPAGFSVNCVSPRVIAAALRGLTSALSGLRPALDLPLGVYANVGEAGANLDGEFTVDVDADEYAGFARGWYREGFRIIGGCCGTTPEYIRRTAAALPAKDPGQSIR